MDTRLLRYYQKKRRGGRSIVARMIDFLMFRFVLAFILFWLLLYFSRSFTVSVLISIFLTIALSLVMLTINKKRTERYIKQDLRRIKEKCLLESLTFMPLNLFSQYMKKLLSGIENIDSWDKGFTAIKDDTKIYVFHNHPGSNVDVSEILDILRENSKPIILISLSDFCENIKMLGVSRDIKLVTGGDILKLAANKNMLPDEQEAEQRAKYEMSASILTLEKLKESTLSKTKIKRYVVCGVIVLLWPLAAGFKFYYPMIAALCFLLALLAYRKSRQSEESGGVGIS